MKEINIARAIVNKRREKGITQDDLANYIGVSKASVSKWETGQSYPDITFLPQLAAYFNISIDDLMGYAPQMTKADIYKLYHELSADFSTKPFEAVVANCQEIAKKYFSCFPLLLQICVLLINHFHLADAQERRLLIMSEVKSLCVRIKCESQDVVLCKQANFMEAMCEIYLGNPQASIELMQDVNDIMLGEEVILANAYYSLGNTDKANETTQVGIYRHLVGLLGDMPLYLLLNANEENGYEEIVKRAIGLCDLFDIKSLHPGLLIELYISAAQGYAMLGEHEKALTLLQEYADLSVNTKLHISITGDEFFDKISGWLEEVELGVKPPRNEQTIRQGLLDKIVKNPVFGSLDENERYKGIVKKLQRFIVKSEGT